MKVVFVKYKNQLLKHIRQWRWFDIRIVNISQSKKKIKFENSFFSDAEIFT
jgi:hypothetical protein